MRYEGPKRSQNMLLKRKSKSTKNVTFEIRKII